MLRHLALAAAIALASCGGGSSDARPIVNSTKGGGGGPTGQATVGWVAPTKDIASIGGQGGATLADLSGFKVYKSVYGPLGPWTLANTVASPSTLTATVTGLASGTWYFCVSSYDSGGREGPCSYGPSVVIP